MLVSQSKQQINQMLISECCCFKTDITSAYVRFDDAALTERVVAFRDIELGEEVTISCRFQIREI